MVYFLLQLVVATVDEKMLDFVTVALRYGQDEFLMLLFTVGIWSQKA